MFDVSELEVDVTTPAKIVAERTRRNAPAIIEDCQTLAGFVRHAWPMLEPANEYIHGWHIEAICEHLEAVTAGEITRLLINVPPGMMKSLLVSVFWPAWEWGPKGLGHHRFIATSYKEDFTKRDSRRMRDLVTSEWFRYLWPNIQLTRSGETSFANTQTGWREGMVFKSLTGERGDRVIIDDPHSTETAESEPERETTLRIFRESVPLRMVNPTLSAIALIMQRLNERDISGWILSQVDHTGYECLILPMEYEPDRKCRTSIGFGDPRIEAGELLFPQRFPREVVERDKSVMGSFAVAGQFQQRPAPRGGGMFKRHWFEFVPAAPAGAKIKKAVRWWDLAATAVSATAPDPDWTVGALLLLDTDGLFYVTDIVRLRGTDLEVERAIRNTAATDTEKYRQCWQIIPEDPGSAGKFVANQLVRQLAGHRVKKGKEDRAKDVRAEPFAAQCEAGNVKIVKAAWNDVYLEEICTFPGSAHDDQLDASSGSFRELVSTFDLTVRGVKGLI